MNTIQKWREIILRQNIRLNLKWEDIKRAASWYIYGNKSFFTRYARQLSNFHKWCFIVGCNNSGTSLLHSILEKTNQVSTLRQEGQRFTTTLTRANKHGYERVWSEYLVDLRLTDLDSDSCFPRLLHDWMRELCLPIHEIIVEKTTVNAVRINWLQKVFPNSYFIAIVRNGYATTEGIMRKGGKSAERGARHWNVVNKIMLKDAKTVKNFLLLRYEELVDSPDDSAAKIAEFLGIDIDKLKIAMRDQYEYTTVVGKSKLHLTNLNSQGISRLSVNDINKIHQNAQEMLEYFGYEP